MIAFMVALAHSQALEFQELLEKYIDPLSPYVIGLETAKDSHQDTSGQHYHVCVNMTDKQYDSFRKTILVKHYNLKGQARDGKARQYGRVRSIKDETKMLQYSVKDKNIIYKNIDLKTIQELIQASYHRPEKRNYSEECLKYLDENKSSFYDDRFEIDFPSIEKAVIQFYRDNTEKILSRSVVKNTTTLYLQKTKHLGINVIYNYLML